MKNCGKTLCDMLLFIDLFLLLSKLLEMSHVIGKPYLLILSHLSDPVNDVENRFPLDVAYLGRVIVNCSNCSLQILVLD